MKDENFRLVGAHEEFCARCAPLKSSCQSGERDEDVGVMILPVRLPHAIAVLLLWLGVSAVPASAQIGGTIEDCKRLFGRPISAPSRTPPPMTSRIEIATTDLYRGNPPPCRRTGGRNDGPPVLSTADVPFQQFLHELRA